MISKIGLAGAIIVVLGIVLAVAARNAIPEGDAWSREQAEALNKLAIFGMVLAGFGAGAATTAIVLVKGPQFRLMNYCPFCGLEKRHPFASCPRCNKRLEL